MDRLSEWSRVISSFLVEQEVMGSILGHATIYQISFPVTKSRYLYEKNYVETTSNPRISYQLLTGPRLQDFKSLRQNNVHIPGIAQKTYNTLTFETHPQHIRKHVESDPEFNTWNVRKSSIQGHGLHSVKLRTIYNDFILPLSDSGRCVLNNGH